MRLVVFMLLAGFALYFISCSGNDPSPNSGASEDSTIVSYLDSLGITNYQTTTSGIYYYSTLEVPSGKTQAEGNVLTIYYEMSVLDGQTLISYDSTDGDPIRLKQGANAIYPLGIDESLSVMKEGEKWSFVIPSGQAFGEYSSTLIPEKAIILFDAYLMQIQDEDSVLTEDNQLIFDYVDSLDLTDTVANPLNQPEYLPNGILYKRLAAGTSPDRPQTGNEISITYTAYRPYEKNTPFDQQYAGEANPFVYNYGMGEVITGLDEGIAQMSRGETALLIIPSLLAYRESSIVLPDYLTDEMATMEIVPTYANAVGPYEVLIFEVKLLSIN